jgi:hypothetical protein
MRTRLLEKRIFSGKINETWRLADVSVMDENVCFKECLVVDRPCVLITDVDNHFIRSLCTIETPPTKAIFDTALKE